ncbi:MAG: acetylxylan esterase [Planctomycetaceae bacterium]|nr:acetylxylan esterase [Planctomycetaceae bacterium]
MLKSTAFIRSLLMVVLTVSVSNSGEAQDKAPEANYDEAKVPKYVLPELLKTNDGKAVTSAADWTKVRRAEVLQLVQDNIFGTLPPNDIKLRTKVRSDVKDAINGLAHRRELTVYFTDDDKGPQMDLLVYTPVSAKGKVPAFLGYNFNGNHAVEKDPRLHITESWVRNDKEHGIDKNLATEASRGSESSRWAVEKIVSAGYGLITIYYGDVDPDFDDGFKNGIHAIFEKPGQPRASNAGGSISAWAWGLSRALDVLESDAEIDAKKVAVFGHSRLGKTSLWAGATDERFAMVISNNSGCGGAALSKREFGERVGRINRSFPHWFCLNHRKYNENEQALPVDHHMLIALAAPRPVYVASAVEDQWADPKGEYLGLYHAGPVFELFGKKPLPTDVMPDLNQPVMTDVAYHIRSGKHDVTDYDWEQYIKFANSHLR